jgi:hypothetical protein
MASASVLDSILSEAYLDKIDSIIGVASLPELYGLDCDRCATASRLMAGPVVDIDRNLAAKRGGYSLSNPPANRQSGSLNDLPSGSADAIVASLKALRSP